MQLYHISEEKIRHYLITKDNNIKVTFVIRPKGIWEKKAWQALFENTFVCRLASLSG
jgi:hypothetical protein